jgi:hypothetical protein
MSSVKKTFKGADGSQSSQKKRGYDRFIPHTVGKNLFNTPVNNAMHSNYE